jgi:iron complex outermembrane receptor protein
MEHHRGAISLMVAAIIATASAEAQTVASTPQSATTGAEEEVIVTGTRTTGLEASESASPVQILSSDTLEQVAGKPSLIDTLATIVPSLTAQAFGGDQANQTLQAKLRGLSPNHVLVLINGKRRHTTANLAVLGGPYQGGAGADLNFIPVSAIDHIEVLTEGAAAQYGTDAIAGVVNIILKKNSSGGNIGATYGGYFDGGGKTGDVTGNIGFEPTDDSYLNLTGEVRNHGRSERGGIDPRVIDPTNIDPLQGGTYPNTNEPLANGYPYLNRIQGDAEYHLQIASFNSGFKFGGGTEFYAFGTYGKKDASSFENYRQPNKSVYIDPNTDLPVYQYPFGFNPLEATQETDYGLTAGVKGSVADWAWDVSETYGDDKLDLYTLNSTNLTIFGDTGASPTDFYDGFLRATQATTNLDINKDFNIGLAGPLNVAFGGEYRRETYEVGVGSLASYTGTGASSYPGFAPGNSGIHDRKNTAVYVDLSLKPVDALLIDVAGRHEHFSDFGNTNVGKLTARYDFTPAFALRGTASTGFRAPTLAEEYYSAINVAPGQITPQLPPNGASAAELGISPLQPEKSTDYGFGVVLRPAPALTATLDVYQIEVKNRIVGTGQLAGRIGGVTYSQPIIDAIAANGIAIEPSIYNTGFVAVSVFTNGITTRTRGAEFVLDYANDYGWGKVDWSIGAATNTTDVTKRPVTPAQLVGGVLNNQLYDQTAISDLETASPKYVINLGALWTFGKVSVNVRESIYGESSEYLSDFGDTGNAPVYYKTTIATAGITNLDLGFQATQGLKFTAGAVNLFNKYPNYYNKNLLATYRAADDNSAVAIYPAFSPYGINGGYYYLRAGYSF